jgi:ADP-ribosyl-[dinitrogen reductase] hydrolase
VKPVEQGVQSEGIGAEGIDLRSGAAVSVDGGVGQPGVTRDSAVADRCRGVLPGLAAGDRNGGPTELAVRLAESLAERRAFDRDDVLARYLAWWREGAFDTGPVAALVLERVACGVPVDKAVAQADRELGGQTAGCNPAHRAAPVAMAAFLADEILGDCAVQEAALTHAHPLAGDVAAAVVGLCRALVRGYGWGAALSMAALGRLPATGRALQPTASPKRLSRGGFAPDVLQAAVHFVTAHASFDAALTASLTFAGPANYCPVLVGSIGGARWGARAIQAEHLAHCRDRPRIAAAAAALSASSQR